MSSCSHRGSQCRRWSGLLIVKLLGALGRSILLSGLGSLIVRSPKWGAPDDIVEVVASSSWTKVGGFRLSGTGMFLTKGRVLGGLDRHYRSGSRLVTTGDVDRLRCLDVDLGLVGGKLEVEAALAWRSASSK